VPTEDVEAAMADKVIQMRSMTKKQMEVTMFAFGVERLEGLKVGKLKGQ
jgi:hypothetical protein